jgi:hypothetical protein
MMRTRLVNRIIGMKVLVAMLKAAGFGAAKKQLIADAALDIFAAKLERSWNKIWRNALRAQIVSKAQSQDDDEFDGEELDMLVNSAKEKAHDDFLADWLAIGLAAYLFAAGISKPTKQEQTIVVEQTAAEYKTIWRIVSGDIERVKSEVARQMLPPLELIPTKDEAIKKLTFAGTAAGGSLPPTKPPTGTAPEAGGWSFSENYKDSLARLIEESNAAATKVLDPVKGLKETTYNMGQDLGYQVGRYGKGDITKEEFRAAAKGMFQDYYREAYRLGKVRAGGAYALNEADLAKIKPLTIDENKFLARWLRDIEKKYTELTPEAFDARMQWRGDLYAKALRGVFHEGWIAEVPDKARVRWVLGIAEHCESCLEEADIGWRTADTLTRVPGDG